MKKTLLFIGIVSLFGIFASGCGYTTRSMLSSKFKTIYVTPFVNKVDITQEYSGDKYRVYRPLLETDVTRTIVNRYILDGNLKPVNQANADLVLKGELIDFRRDPLRYTDNDDVAEYRLNVVVNITLWDTKENRMVWDEKGFTGYYSYFTQGPAATPESGALNNAIDDLARRIVERTVDQW